MRDCWILCISIAVIGVAMATNETDTFLYRTIMEYGQAGLISADGLNTLLVDYRANYEGGCKADRRVPANASQCFGSLNVTDCLTSMVSSNCSLSLIFMKTRGYILMVTLIDFDKNQKQEIGSLWWHR